MQNQLEEEEHVQIMLKIKRKLESPIFENNNDQNYKLILYYIKKYIEENCNHKIIEDLIDIDGDTSMNVSYCTKCETSFS